jgi:monoamine oxidase
MYWTKKCVCAVPKQVIEKMGDRDNLFSEIRPDLSRIECGSLCRIYCQFDKGSDGKVWFHNLGKLTVDNEIRMIIPIDVERGIIMISYTDNKWADEWNRIYKTEGIRVLNRTLRDKVSSVVGYTIPPLKHTQVFYWKCGVGYWGKDADSREIEDRVVEIKKGLFMCGEHYSSDYQQWMEGALRTSSRVIRILV